MWYGHGCVWAGSQELVSEVTQRPVSIGQTIFFSLLMAVVDFKWIIIYSHSWATNSNAWLVQANHCKWVERAGWRVWWTGGPLSTQEQKLPELQLTDAREELPSNSKEISDIRFFTRSPLPLLEDFVLVYRERRREKEQLAAYYMPQTRDRAPQPRHVPWPGDLNQQHFGVQRKCPTHWAMPARASPIIIFFMSALWRPNKTHLQVSKLIFTIK